MIRRLPLVAYASLFIGIILAYVEAYIGIGTLLRVEQWRWMQYATWFSMVLAMAYPLGIVVFLILRYKQPKRLMRLLLAIGAIPFAYACIQLQLAMPLHGTFLVSLFIFAAFAYRCTKQKVSGARIQWACLALLALEMIYIMLFDFLTAYYVKELPVEQMLLISIGMKFGALMLAYAPFEIAAFSHARQLKLSVAP